jgi:hypothetical protein
MDNFVFRLFAFHNFTFRCYAPSLKCTFAIVRFVHFFRWKAFRLNILRSIDTIAVFTTIQRKTHGVFRAISKRIHRNPLISANNPMFYLYNSGEISCWNLIDWALFRPNQSNFSKVCLHYGWYFHFLFAFRKESTRWQIIFCQGGTAIILNRTTNEFYTKWKLMKNGIYGYT